MSELAFDVISPDDERYLVALRGKLCWPDAERLWERLDMLINRGVLLVLDLENVELVDSSGVRVLLLAQREAAQRGATLRLAAPSTLLTWLLERGGVDDLFDTRPDARSAMADHNDDGAPSSDGAATRSWDT